MKKLSTLKVKFPLITFCTYLLLIAVILVVCYFRFFNVMISSYQRIGEEVLNLACGEINVDHINDYLKGLHKAEYANTLDRLNEYVKNCNEVYYLYCYKIPKKGTTAKVVFDAETEHDGEGDALGTNYELEPELAKHIDELRTGKELEPLVDDTSWGYLMTCCRPLYDSKGICRAYMFIDFNMAPIKQANINFIIALFLVVFCIMFTIFCVSMHTVKKRITGPLESMYLCLKSFKFDSDADKLDNIQRFKDLDIHTNPEIQSIYDIILRTTEDSYTYMEEYQIAANRLGVANELAYNDALTGFLNKNSYDTKCKEYQRMLDDGISFNLAVLMIDINNLKYINDTYGHTAGDKYIRGCCEIMKDIIKYSYTYRVGGDEFIIFLSGTDYDNRHTIFKDISNLFNECYTDKSRDEVERYSASIGMSVANDSDKTITDIIKRADSEMYKSKAAFKHEYGSYR